MDATSKMQLGGFLSATGIVLAGTYDLWGDKRYQKAALIGGIGMSLLGGILLAESLYDKFVAKGGAAGAASDLLFGHDPDRVESAESYPLYGNPPGTNNPAKLYGKINRPASGETVETSNRLGGTYPVEIILENWDSTPTTITPVLRAKESALLRNDEIAVSLPTITLGSHRGTKISANMQTASPTQSALSDIDVELSLTFGPVVLDQVSFSYD